MKRFTHHHQEGHMIRSLLFAVTMLSAVLLASGCVGTTELVRALGQDPASVCVSVTMIYGNGAACRVGSATEVKAGDGQVSVTAK